MTHRQAQDDRTTRCGVVAVIGAPNAGKSTLVNQLVGQKVAITSAKAQTTRARMLGIALHGETQMILVDTPGIFAPRRRLDRAMVSAAWEGAESADAILLLVDPIKQRRHELEPLIEALATRPEKKILVLNKVDRAKKEPLLALAQELSGKVDFAEIFFVSALTGDGVPELKDALAAMMPEGVWHYPEDQVSDASERLLAAEVTPSGSTPAPRTSCCGRDACRGPRPGGSSRSRPEGRTAPTARTVRRARARGRGWRP